MCPDDQNVNSKAEEVAAKYNKLFKLYGTCHRGIHSGSILCENDIKQLGKRSKIEIILRSKVL